MSKDEVILYATPTGAFSDACDRYWASLHKLDSPTTAQTYPPHCTLTGFFHRRPADIPRLVNEVVAVSGVTGSELTVQSARLEKKDGWVGFVLESHSFEAAIREFVSRHVVRDGDDALRPKTWLHLSLSYGDGADPDRHMAEARRIFDGVDPGPWSLGLWCRRDGSWCRLGPGSPSR